MKYLHTMIRVANLDRSLHFYCEALGFRLTSREDHAEDKFTLAFLRAEGDSGDRAPLIELTHNWDTDHYERGNAYGHVAYQVKSIEDVQARLKKHGFDLSWGPGMTPNKKRKMAFIDDPDGYEIELIEYQDES
jgi:lactoylglutathione lyase